MEVKRTSKGSWSQLPIDILDNIIKRLDLPVDVVSFSGVCKPWRYVALGTHMSQLCKLPMHHFAPKWSSLPMLLHPGCEDPDTHKLYSLNERKLYGGFCLQELSNKWIVGSGAGWLVTVDTSDPEINLLNPLTGKKIPLPHLSTLPCCARIIDDDDPTAYWYVDKVIVCCHRGIFLIVALVATARTIRFCRIGDSKWTRLEMSPLWVDDIIMHNGKLYAVNTMGGLFEIDIYGSAKVTLIAMPYELPYVFRFFLVDVCGELFLLSRQFSMYKRKIKRHDGMTAGFEVLKLVKDESGFFDDYESEFGTVHPEKATHSWVPVENLGHHMVFVGYNHSLSLDSRVYPGCEGNCIYFADCRGEEDYLKIRGSCAILLHDVGMYHLGRQRVKRFNKFCDASSPMNMVWLSPNFSTEFGEHRFLQ